MPPELETPKEIADTLESMAAILLCSQTSVKLTQFKTRGKSPQLNCIYNSIRLNANEYRLKRF